MPVQEGATRAQVLRRAIIGGGAIVGAAAAASGLPQPTAAASGEQDARVLNLVLAVEYTEAAFYAEALERGALSGDLEDFARTVAQHEKEHVAFLEQALGAGADSKPRHDFGDRTKDAKAFAAAAVKLEDLAVATYNGQAVNLTSGSLKAAARIVSVEARHAAWIRSIVGDVPATEAVDPAIKEAETRSRLKALGWRAA
jgi:rubrerythrin